MVKQQKTGAKGVTRKVGIALATVFLAMVSSVEAQPRSKIPQVGLLRHSRQADEPRLGRLEEFRQGLSDLGYVQGHNIFLEVRWSEARLDRLPELAAELVRLQVDVIVVHGVAGVQAAKNATNTLPVVMARMDDADTRGIVASLARPGGNVTGLSFQTQELSGKWLELLKETVPRLSRVAVVYQAGAETQRRTLEEAAQTIGVRLQIFPVRNADGFNGTFAAAHTAKAEGLVLLASLLLTDNASRLAALAANYRLPAIYYHRDFTDAGGLMAYGPNESDPSWGWRRAATYVDKILKGAKPADLPVEQPRKFELVINLKTAKQLGLTIPQSVLYRADRVIK
jgi:putative tryptophan/tyrosine transport system substrate-binding protein